MAFALFQDTRLLERLMLALAKAPDGICIGAKNGKVGVSIESLQGGGVSDKLFGAALRCALAVCLVRERYEKTLPELYDALAEPDIRDELRDLAEEMDEKNRERPCEPSS